MTTYTYVFTVLLASLLACLFTSVYAYEEYGDYLLPDTDGYYPLDKRAYNHYCKRCMSSESDWLSCYKCWDSPGRSAPFFGKKKRGHYEKPGHIVPYFGKRASETMEDLSYPEEGAEFQQKRAFLSTCTCCMRIGDDRCCAACNSIFEKREEKRDYETSFADYGEEESCACCQKGSFSLYCCLKSNCLQKK